MEIELPELTWHSFDGGLAEIGYPLRAGDPLDFCFDNETPRHNVFLEAFQIANREVTCREYLEFISDNAYTRPELWLSDGWDTVKRAAWQAPLYWRRDAEDETGWRVFTLAGWHGLSALLDTPVCHVSCFEADAFARWKGCRLPTEAEWEHVASQATVQGNLLESGRLHPAAARGAGIQQLFGDCWEWTSSAYTGYPGYKPLPGALGEYNGKFMSGQMILRGGSCVTPASHIRATYRNFFSPTTRWQFTGNSFGCLKGPVQMATYLETVELEHLATADEQRSTDSRSSARIGRDDHARCHRGCSTMQRVRDFLSESRPFPSTTPLAQKERSWRKTQMRLLLVLTTTDRLPLRLVELGAGTASKTCLLLEAALRLSDDVAYVPVDVCSNALELACENVECALPEVRVQPIVRNYVTHPLNSTASTAPHSQSTSARASATFRLKKHG